MKNDMGVKLNVDTREMERLVIGGRLYDALQWTNNGSGCNLYSILQCHKESEQIVIKESDLLKLIQLVNSGQQDRHIKLV